MTSMFTNNTNESEKTGNVKTLYCIRHGLALHNVLFWEIGTKAYTEYQDTRLLEEGVEQAIELGNKKILNNVELVIVSPLSRTLSTAYHIFKNTNIPIVAIDFLIEHPLGGDEFANKRKSISCLKKIFPKVNFDLITQEEPYWPKKRNNKRIRSKN